MKSIICNIKCRQEEKHVSKRATGLVNIFSTIALFLGFVVSCPISVQATSSAVLDEARTIIKTKYVNEVPDSVLNAPTIEEMVKGLNDPYSQYFSKQEEEDFINSIDNKTYGIGIYMEIIPDGVKVKNVIENSPASEAGLNDGDIIVSAEDKSLAGLTSEQASSYIKGEEGTVVNLVVKRGTSNINFNITRRAVSIPTVEGKILNDNTAYISISSFGSDTAELFTKKLQELKAKNPESYLIDLRNNGGGYMGTALNIAGNFIGENLAIIVENKQGKRVGYLAQDNGNTIDKPVIFLINEYSASASEILSAAVKDYKKAFFIGTTTYGKGVAQQIFTLSDGSSLKLTVEKFYSPKGNIIQKAGVSPDFNMENVDPLVIAELFSGKYKSNISKNKEFTITFNKGVDVNTIKDNVNIEIINAKDGEHTAFDIKKVDDKKVSIAPKKELKNGETYYIKVKDKIKVFTVNKE